MTYTLRVSLPIHHLNFMDTNLLRTIAAEASHTWGGSFLSGLGEGRWGKEGAEDCYLLTVDMPKYDPAEVRRFLLWVKMALSQKVVHATVTPTEIVEV